MTLTQIIFVSVIGVLALLAVVWYAYDQCSVKAGIIGGLIVLVVVALIFVGLYWYNHNTAKGVRYLGEFQKNLNNGVEREIYIYAEDGREIYYYKGRIDIDDTKTAYCLYFYDQDGKSHIIHYGVQDTVIITEIEVDEK